MYFYWFKIMAERVRNKEKQSFSMKKLVIIFRVVLMTFVSFLDYFVPSTPKKNIFTLKDLVFLSTD